MSKATNRKLRRQLERKVIQRQRDEQEAKRRRLRGFKTATTGDMLREIGHLPPDEADRLAVSEVHAARRERARER